MTIHVHDDAVEPALAPGETKNFDMAVIVNTVKGGTVTTGTRILIEIRAGIACELRVLYAVDGPDGVLTFVDRGTVDKVCEFADFRAVYAALGTNVRFAVKNVDTSEGGIAVYTTIL